MTKVQRLKTKDPLTQDPRLKTQDQHSVKYAPANQYNPQCVVDRRPLAMWGLVAAGVVILLGLIVGAPVAQASNHRFLAFTIYEAFSHLCHQARERSFFVASHPFAVCARCTGVYVGFAAATLMYPLLISLRRVNTPERKWLLIAAAPLAIDFALGFLGIWANTHSSRFLTGALLGAAVVFYVLPGLVELSLRWRSYISRTAPAKQSQTIDPGATGERISSAPSDYSAPLRRI